MLIERVHRVDGIGFLEGAEVLVHGFQQRPAAGESRIFYERFLSQLRAGYNPDAIKDGVFGAMMQVMRDFVL